jgi:hypothetical protein
MAGLSFTPKFDGATIFNGQRVHAITDDVIGLSTVSSGLTLIWKSTSVARSVLPKVVNTVRLENETRVAAQASSLFMVKWATSALLCVCLLTPLLSLFASDVADDEYSIPACCRRDGKHHCAMMAGAAARARQQQLETRIGRAPESCPYRSAPPARLNPQQFGALHSVAYYVGFVGHPASFPYLELAALVSQSRTHYKRGPPALL